VWDRLPIKLTFKLTLAAALICGQRCVYASASEASNSSASGADNRYCGKGNKPQFGTMSDGPAALPSSCFYTGLDGTPSPGKAITATDSSSLRTALNSAACGDIISLKAGVVFSGSFILPAKKCDDAHWIQIRVSTPDAQLPAEGQRLTPCFAGVPSLPGRPPYDCPSGQADVLAHIVSSANNAAPFTYSQTIDHYRFGPGLEITRAAGTGIVHELLLPENDASANHIVFERVWGHGTPTDETTRFALFDGVDIAAVDSYFNDFRCTAVTGSCTDSQVFAGGLGSNRQGNWKIVNNFLEAAAQSILFGGGAATQVPTDIEIRRNDMFKPLSWMPLARMPGKGRPIVKNGFELKNAQRVLFEGNRIENVWGGFTQSGFAIVLTPKNPGGCSVCTVRDITIRNSLVTHSGAAMQIFNGLSDAGNAAQEGSHYSIHDLIFDDMNYPACYGCNGDMFQIGSHVSAPPGFWLHDIAIRHVTVATTRARAGWIISGPVGQPNLTFQDSIVDNGLNGHTNAGGGPTQCYFGREVMKGVLDACWSSYKFDHNVVMQTAAESWPANNWPVGNPTKVGFVSWNNGVGGDYQLTSTSKFKGQASDGKDPGADVDAVAAAIVGIQ
jgi:hypothetical protein